MRGQPTIVITRPKAQADVFAHALGSDVQILIAPLMRIDPVTSAEIGDPAHVIFTSVNGVDQAGRLGVTRHATAWCVGDQTARAAIKLGFTVKNAKGSSDDLVRMIIDAKPQGALVHLRGAHVTGQIVERLTQAGLQCTAQIVYAQVDEDPSPALRGALAGKEPLIIPIFSMRSAHLLAQTLPHFAPMTLVAISQSVADVTVVIPNVDVITASFPDKDAMITATLQAYAALSPAKTP